MTKYTPGPWHAEWDDNGQWYIEPLGVTGTKLRGDSGECVESATARLIAAAPDLHEELRDVAAFIRTSLQVLVHVPTTDERGHIVNGYAAAQIPDWQLKQRLESIEAAIAKAEGAA